MDADGYPTDEELQELRDWPMDRSHLELVEWLEERWRYPDYITRTQRRVYISTGGWSGHEELLWELRRSKALFWQTHWVSSRSGGHHVFDLTSIKRWDRGLTSRTERS